MAEGKGEANTGFGAGAWMMIAHHPLRRQPGERPGVQTNSAIPMVRPLASTMPIIAPKRAKEFLESSNVRSVAAAPRLKTLSMLSESTVWTGVFHTFRILRKSEVTKRPTVDKSRTQAEKFLAAARQLSADEDEARWSERLRKMAKPKPGKAE